MGMNTRRLGCTSTTRPRTRGGCAPVRSMMTTSRTLPTWSALGSSTVMPASRARKTRVVVPVAMPRGYRRNRRKPRTLVFTGMGVLDMFSLDGKVAIVTGASSGLGVAFAQALAEAGADVVLGAPRGGRLPETKALVGGIGRRAPAVATHVAHPPAGPRPPGAPPPGAPPGGGP